MSSVHVVKGAHHACYSDPSSVCPALPVEQMDDDDHPTACQDGFEVCLDESEEEWPGDDAPFVEDEQLY